MKTQTKIMILLFTLTLALGTLVLLYASDDVLRRFRWFVFNDPLQLVADVTLGLRTSNGLWYAWISLSAMIMVGLTIKLAMNAELRAFSNRLVEAEVAKAEWMPLGTFAVAADEKDVDPTRAVQLAVNKQGVISGTLFNTETDKAQTLQGQVDKETQRVAFRVGESENIVVETGLYNLTQNEAPVLVHFGADKVENWLLVRLPQPEEEKKAE